MRKSEASRGLADILDGKSATEDEGLTAAQIAAAYKAALADFVHGKTNRKSLSELGKMLSGALAARRQLLAERDGPTANRFQNQYLN